MGKFTKPRSARNFRGTLYHYMEKHILFFRTSWKDGLSKKFALEYGLTCIIGKDDISVFWKYDITPWTENERWTFSKKHMEILYFLQVFWKMIFSKRSHRNMSFLVLSGKMVFVFAETQYFFFAQKMKDDFSKEILGDTVFSAYMQALKTWCWAPPPKKNQRYSSPTKIHLKMIDILVWHSRKGSNNSLYFYENLCRLFHILLFTKKIHSRH